MLNTKIIGQRITEARKKMQVSQAELAQQLFISPQAVGKWERGESMPDIITLNRLAEILGVDLNYFSGGQTTAGTESTFASLPETESTFQSPGKQQPKLNWDMSRGNWVDADFSGLKDLHEKFSSSHLKNCRFVGSELSGLLLSGNHVEGCDFSGSDLSSSQIKGSHLVSNQFQHCALQGIEFSGSDIRKCDFGGANLRGAKFKASGFTQNTVADAVWDRTSFIGTHLSDLVFNGTLEDCYFENCAFSKVTFENATLINTFFKNKTLKHIRFVDCQADRLTYEFLKNGKADLAGITLLNS